MIASLPVTTAACDTRLTRDVAVLSTLAHVAWLTTDQLHALCFPETKLATVRTALRYYEEAGWLRRARWGISGCPKHHVWTITTKGNTIVARYTPIHVQPQFVDLSRPSTALEQDEHRVQMVVRTFLVRLILEARARPCLAQLSVTLKGGTPAHSGVPFAAIAPDAMLSVVWEPARRQAAIWLPWRDGAQHTDHLMHYPLYVDRAVHPDQHAVMFAERDAPSATHPCIPLLICDHDDRLRAVQHTLQARMPQQAVRMSTWTRLERGITEHTWQDAAGHACTLRPEADMERKEAA